MITSVGKKLRDIRKQKRITLAALASQVGLSVGFLSNLERDLSSPTLDNVQKVCSALDISLMDLMDDVYDTSEIIRQNERKIVFERENKVRYESISFGLRRMQGLVIVIEPENLFEKEWSHGYDEIGIVLEGELVITIRHMEYFLQEGDAFYIEAGAEHSLANRGNRTCVSYWVKSVNDAEGKSGY